FEIETKAAPLALGVGDPVTVTTTIRGNGDLASMAPPSIAATDTLRVYPVQPSGQPAPGERTFEQVVIPLRAGTVALPEMRLSYFDPEGRAYRTTSQPPVNLSVHPSAGQATGSQVVGAAGPRPAPEKLGRDLVFIKDDPGPLAPIRARRHRGAPFWAWQLRPPAAGPPPRGRRPRPAPPARGT